MRRHKTQITINRLRNRGWTYTKIGTYLGLSRERIRQIYNYDYHTKELDIKCKGCKEEITVNNRSFKYCRKCRLNLNLHSGRGYVRDMVRKRDKYTCQDCGEIRTPQEVKRYNSKFPDLKGRIKMFDIHHIDGRCGKNSRGYDRIDDISGLITLCHKCHYNRPEHRSKSKSFSNKLKRYFKTKDGIKHRQMISKLNRKRKKSPKFKLKSIDKHPWKHLDH